MIELISQNQVFSWLILGSILVAVESFIIPGIGMLFAGLAGIITALALYLNLISHANFLGQVACFFVFTGIWALLLWKPIKKLYSSGNNKYNDVIGTKAIIYDKDLSKDSLGKVKWSGTIMNARLYKDEADHSLPVGTEVQIVEASGNTFTVKKI